ncbi:pupal cuticle protein 27 [Halyomorpha halys]|uniref:pupal cuticle protein 27 n=1 Tax=Halyomorpha halys TaxID=286706 RepID=UPI0006D5001A|nr:pupal cuticle protein 27-like isoform X2 [Halyomorpha halys]
MILMLVTLVVAAEGAKLRAGQQSPRGAQEAGGGQFLASPDQGAYQGPGGGSPAYTGAASPPVAILAYSNQPVVGDGTYAYNFQGENGIQAQETGSVGGPEAGTSAQGTYSYVSPEGQTIVVSYSAGEGGFIPTGDHIPVPPPVPQQILDALAKNAADEAAGIFDDGKYRGEKA